MVSHGSCLHLYKAMVFYTIRNSDIFLVQAFHFTYSFCLLITGIYDILLQGSVWPLGFAMRSCSMLRNRMLADPSFLFKIGTEVCLAFYDIAFCLKIFQLNCRFMVLLRYSRTSVTEN